MGYSRMISENFGGSDLPPESQAFFDAIGPEKVVPMAVYLASRECRVTHHNFSAAAGRYARVSMGLGRGWFAPGPEPATADDVARTSTRSPTPTGAGSRSAWRTRSPGSWPASPTRRAGTEDFTTHTTHATHTTHRTNRGDRDDRGHAA